MGVEFVGKRGALFWLALKTGFFTILTLGIYRFWMKTRLRRWYWSAIRPGGHPMEYVGDPFEKLLGFFIAVVILTFYIGIVNLLLMFVSFSVFNSSWVGYLASIAGVIPIWFYARYRARRYVLGRTRWRGVRFALEPGAWGYAGRAMLYWFLTIISLGVLWPRMTFLLEKYRTDRTYFGSAKLLQGGRWQMLYRAAIPFVLALVATSGVAAWLLLIDPVWPDTLSDVDRAIRSVYLLLFQDGEMLSMNWPERLFLIPLCMSALVYGAIHYRWATKRIMANHKSADGVRFASKIKPPRVTMIYVLGISLSYSVLVFGLALLILLVIGALGFDAVLGDDIAVMADMPQWLSFVLLGALYLGVFLLWGVLHNTFVTFPLMRHMALTTTLPTASGLARISQRTRDEFAEAEGFAEALDLGAAI
ncbi:DUF898 family protein [Sulfitobacter aestuariivivens]|uniref:DUF898 family protein n=1 Tax=Sulfitobacter aestuariivivens TaxID=2766981 RepID=A0A927D675_9RHOB|nr:DUF898 family protein [Sulfitobacter aestuariivivens]MBD3665955.1 DUF898 family protein [Sulfitobacter aestuariivivens]